MSYFCGGGIYETLSSYNLFSEIMSTYCYGQIRTCAVRFLYLPLSTEMTTFGLLLEILKWIVTHLILILLFQVSRNDVSSYSFF